MVESPSIRVLVVDDHWVVRNGLALILKGEEGLELAGLAATGEEAVAAFRSQHPDVVVMDLQLPGMSGVDAIRAIREWDPRARIIVLTMYDGDEDIHRALDAGATTYLLKGSPSDDLIRVIRAVHAGGRPIPEDIRARLEGRASRATLTQREVEVLQLVLQGSATRRSPQAS